MFFLQSINSQYSSIINETRTDAASEVGGCVGVVDMVGPVETELTMGSWDQGDLGAGGGMLVSGSVVAGVPSCPKFKCPDHREPCCCFSLLAAAVAADLLNA